MDEQSIFLAALQKETPEERSEFVAEACGDDEGMRHEVELLLKAHEKAGDFLQAAPTGIGKTIDHPGTERAGSQIGPYKLLQKLGEGGMGEVYLAEQSEPVERRVAVKIIKAGMDTRQVIARFEAERQALAMMDHPNIAKVFDAGTTETGRPYFAMEMVKGVPITEYCDEHQLDLRQRLALFQDVCHAVQHAHQKGVIHRDIKPSNVLVAEYDDHAVPKVIDFGVAKATQQRLTEKTMFTEVGTVVGTIEYMSPEQAKLNQLDIDTRSDVYSLGVLLYELLTGETPFDRKKLRSAALDEMLRIIREEEPSRPSIKLRTSESLPSIAANRHVEPRKLGMILRGELDWIVMKALEKERQRRYETANGFAADIQRYLNDEAVEACPPSAAYRFKKFTKRNQRAMAISSVFAILLVVVAIGSLLAATRFRDLANRNANLVVEKDLALTKSIDSEKAASEASEREIERRKEASTHLYESLNREVVALRASRTPGYREQAWRRLDEARQVDTPIRDLDQLRQQAILCMGDFVGIAPTVLDFQRQGVYGVGLNHDATLAAIGHHSGDITIYDLVANKKVDVLEGHSTAVCSLVFSDDGASLVTGDYGGTVCIWGRPDESAWTQIKTLTLDDADVIKVMRITLTSNSKLALIHRDGSSSLHLLDLVKAELMEAGLGASQEPYKDATIRADGKVMAAVSKRSRELVIWDVEAPSEQRRLALTEIGNVISVSFSPSNSYIACGCANGMAILELPDLTTHMSIKGEQVNRVAFSADEKTFAFQTAHDRSAQVWDLATNRMRATLPPGDTADADLTSITFSSGRQVLASATAASVSFWKVNRTPEQVATLGHEHAVQAVDFSGDDRHLVSCSANGNVRLWDAETGRLERVIVEGLGSIGQYNHGHFFSPSGRILATTDWNTDQLSLWDTRSWRRIGLLEPNKLGANGHQPVYLAFSPDESHLATSGSNGIAIWTLPPYEQLVAGESSSGIQLKHHIKGSVAFSVQFSPDGAKIASIWFTRVRAWQFPSMTELPSPPLKAYNIWCDLAFLPDSTHIAYVSSRRAVELWDLGADRLSLSLGRGEIRGRHIAISPDGRLIAGLSSNAEVAVWDLGTQQRLATLPRRRNSVWYLDWSSDRRLALAISNGEIEIWNFPAIRSELEKIALAWPEIPDDDVADVITAQPLSEQDRLELAQAYLDRCYEFEAEGRLGNAIEDLQRVGELAGDKLDVRYTLALMQLCAGHVFDYQQSCRRTVDQLEGGSERQAAEPTPITEDQLAAWAAVLFPNALENYGSLVDEVQSWKNANSEDAFCLTLLGAAMLRAGETDTAIGQLKTADELLTTQDDESTSPAYGWFLLSIAYGRRGDEAESRRWLERAEQRMEVELSESTAWNRRRTLEMLRTEAVQGSAKLWNHQARLLAEQGDHKQAQIAWRKAVDEARETLGLQLATADYWNNLGIALYRIGEYEEAIESLEKADGMIQGGDREHRMFLAMALWKLGRKEEAQQKFGQGAVWIVNNRPNNERLLRLRSEAENSMGLSEEHREALIEAYYGHRFPADATAQEFIDRATWFRNRGLREQATKSLTAALKLDPNSSQAYNDRAWDYIVLGEYEQAVADCDEAIKLDPRSTRALADRAWANNMLGRFADAIADCDQAIKIDPKHYFAFQRRAWAHREIGELDRAAADAKKAIEIDPRIPYAFSELAWVLIASQQWDEAAWCFEQLVELQPKNTGNLKQLAWCEYMSRGVDAYRQRCRMAIERFITPEASAPVKRDVVQMCCSVMNAVDDTEAMVQLAREVIAANPPKEGWTQAVFVDALLCNGQSDEAISLLLGDESDAANNLRGPAMFLLAKAYHASKKTDVAIEWLNKADTWTSQYLAQGDYEFPVFPLILQVGQKDAHEFLGIPASQDSTSVESTEVATSSN